MSTATGGPGPPPGPGTTSGGAGGTAAAAAGANATASASCGPEDDYGQQDQLKVFSNEGDGENTEHLNSMDLHDIKTELERDAEKAETPKAAADAGNSDGSNPIATTSSGLPQASIRPVIHHPTAMVYANGSAVPFMIPPFAAAAAGGSPLYPVMRPVKLESDWKASQSVSTGQLSLGTYSYPAAAAAAGFLPVDQNGLRPAYPFMAIPSQYLTTQMPYQAQFAALGQSVAPNATVQPNSGGMIAAQVKEKKPHIKKPLNAFMLFMKQKRADVIKECTLKESAAINQILGKMWHALDRSEQAKYYEMAREERAKHMQMYPGWSARDNYAIHKKRRKRKVKQVDSKGDDVMEEEAGKKESGEQEVCVPALGPGSGLATSPVAPLIQGAISPIKTTSTILSQRTEEDEIDLNNRKCRARFGLDQQHRWCGPCRRKKKCIRYSLEDDDHLPRDAGSEVEDEVLVTPGSSVTEASVMLSEATAEDDNCHSKDLPHMLRHDVPVTLQTIPT